MACNNACSQCNQCDCNCSNPSYTDLGCPSYPGFSCVQLKEKNSDGSAKTYPSLNNFKTGDDLYDLLGILNQWKSEYNTLKASDLNIPSSSSYTGTKGSIKYSTGFLYICIANNTWRRVALSSF